jgi:hypothetical protein
VVFAMFKYMYGVMCWKHKRRTKRSYTEHSKIEENKRHITDEALGAIS